MITYVQCLKYPIDAYAGIWFNQVTVNIAGYIDLSMYSRNLPSMVTSVIAILYAIFGVILVVL